MTSNEPPTNEKYSSNNVRISLESVHGSGGGDEAGYGSNRQLLGENYEKLMANEKTTTEKRTIANIQDRAKRKTVTSSDKGQTIPNLSNEGHAMAMAFGNDPLKVAERIKQNNKRR